MRSQKDEWRGMTHMYKKRVVIISNIPSPYKVDLFYELQKNTEDYVFYPVYTNASEDNRTWEADNAKLGNSVILSSRVLKLSTGIDHRYIHFPPSISPVLDRINPDFVIAGEYNPAALLALRWCKRKHRKFIHLTEGTLNSEQNLNPVQRASRKYICKNADGFIAASTRSKEKLMTWGVPEQDIEVALLTVDINPYLSLPYMPESGRILYVGSLAERKGLDLLVQALPLIRQKFELHIVGDHECEEKEQLKQMLKDKHLDHKVVWRGFLQGEELYKEYQEASVFVLPTREDCFGLVLVEALAAGVPIVASKYADGSYDVVKEGINGTIVDPFIPSALARGIESFLHNDTDRRAVSQETVEQFKLSSVIKHYYRILSTL